MNSAPDMFEEKTLPKELITEEAFVPATHRFLLTPQEAIFVLEKGKLDLFAVTYKERKGDYFKLALSQIAKGFLSYPAKFFPGALKFLTTIEEGNWLFPFPVDVPEASICIMAIAREDCHLTILNATALRQAIPRSPALQILTMHQIEQWVNCLNANNQELLRESLPISLVSYEKHALESGTSFMASRTHAFDHLSAIAWLKVHQGNICPWDCPQLTIKDPQILYPISSEEWFHCQANSVVEFHPSHTDFLLDEGSWLGLALFQRHFLFLTFKAIDQNLATRREEMQQLVERDQLLLNQSFADLQNLLNPQAIVSLIPKENLLCHACQIVGDYLELKFKWPKAISGNREEDLQKLCMNSEIYYRRVKLVGQWWQDLSFPFVAFYGKGQVPVAIIPLKGGGFQCINSNDDTKQPVTPEMAKELSSFGYMFYRQLTEPTLNIKTIWNFVIHQRKGELFTFLFLVLCSTIASLSLPIFTSFLFDDVIPNRNEFMLWEIALGATLISLATMAFNLGREVIILRFESFTDHDLEMAVWQRLIQQPLRFFRRYSLYDLFTFTEAIGSIRKLLVSHTIEVIFDALFSVLYFFLMFYYSPLLSVVGLGILAIEMIAIGAPVYFGIKYERKLLETQIQANNKMLEMVQALTKVRLAGAEARMFNRWEQAFAGMAKMDLKVLFLQTKSGVFNLFWSNASTWILYVTVIFIVFHQETAIGSIDSLTLGSFMAFISVFGLFSSALTALGDTLLNIIGAVPLWEKMKEFSESEPEELSSKPDPGTLQGEIRIDHVTFSYQPDVAPVLKDLSLIIRPGESVAFVGQSGCGKTTILRLLLGFERLDQGSIYYDNKDMRGLNLQAIRRQLGVVLQSGAIFDGTILENINSGRHYQPEQVQAALDLIGAETFIQELPMGINTVLTNGGTSLSGGQRQMILLARAIVGKPKILILDEATSALDNHKQKIIYQHLNKLSMTQVIVAQRLDTIQHVTRIYVVDDGQIVDQGTFTELANKPGLFAEMLNKAGVG